MFDVSGFWPGTGKEACYPVERIGVEEPFQGDAGIGVEQTHVGHPGLGNFAQSALYRSPFQFDAHEVPLGGLLGLPHEKFPVAKADFHLYRDARPKRRANQWMFGLLPGDKGL